jgi:hypothetical protein
MQPMRSILRSFPVYLLNRDSFKKSYANNGHKTLQKCLKLWFAQTQLVIMQSNRKVYSVADNNGLHGSE